MEECKYGIKNNKMKNLVNDDFGSNSSDSKTDNDESNNESHSESDNESKD